MTVARKQDSQFTPDIDCEIIRGYVDGQEAMFEHLEKRYGLGRSTVTKRANALGINERLIQQLKLGGFTYGPRSCLDCNRVFASRGPENRLCSKCAKRG